MTDRPGHDRRYAISCEKIKREVGWSQAFSFESGLAETIQWYQQNPAWLSEIRSGEYQDYFDRHYTRREATFAAVSA